MHMGSFGKQMRVSAMLPDKWAMILMRQTHFYGGLSMCALAAEVGIKTASIYHHFTSKVDLAAAIAERYWQDTKAWPKDVAVAVAEGDATAALRKYPETVRMSLENGNRLCLGSSLGAVVR